MQFPDILKKYRANKKISQKELAEQLKIPAISVSRMEQGINVRLEISVVNQLGSMMEDNALDNIDGISEIRRWFDRAKCFNTSQNLQGNIRAQFKEDIEKGNVIKKIVSDFSSIGFKYTGGKSVRCQAERRYLTYTWGEPREVIGFDIVFFNEKIRKVWAIDFLWDFPSPFEYTNDETCLNILYNSLGRSTFVGQYNEDRQKIHKYSLVTNLLALTEYLEDNPIGRLSLNYDFSIIHYNLEKCRMDREVNLTFFKDGQGLFDLNVEGKEEKATLDYAKWNLLLSE